MTTPPTAPGQDVSPEDVAFGESLFATSAPAIRNALAEMVAARRDPRLHCVMVAPAKGLPGVPQTPEGEEYFAVTHLSRAAAARMFLERWRSDIATVVLGYNTSPGCGLVVLSWPTGTQFREMELPAGASGGRA